MRAKGLAIAAAIILVLAIVIYFASVDISGLGIDEPTGEANRS